MPYGIIADVTLLRKREPQDENSVRLTLKIHVKQKRKWIRTYSRKEFTDFSRGLTRPWGGVKYAHRKDNPRRRRRSEEQPSEI